MWRGEVLCTYIAPAASAPMVKMPEVRAVAGKGLEGDRYAKGIGHFSHNEGVHRQVTLFESEVLDTLRRDYRKELSPADCRMNLITRGVPLSHLVGTTFKIGEVTLRGVKLNEPCNHLEEVVGQRISGALVHRCGLFAEILEGGCIRSGDTVEQDAAADERLDHTSPPPHGC